MTQNAQLKAGSDTEPAFSLPGPLRNECAIWLVRHGETEWSKSGQHTGRTDLPLTLVGIEKARDLGRLLAGKQFAAVFTSPMQRASETCRLAGFDDAIVDANLQEWDYGDYEGKSTPDIRKERPDWDLW